MWGADTGGVRAGRAGWFGGSAGAGCPRAGAGRPRSKGEESPEVRQLGPWSPACRPHDLDTLSHDSDQRSCRDTSAGRHEPLATAKRSPQGRRCRASQRREVRGAPEPAREKRPSACSPCLAPWGLAARPPRGPSGCRAVLRHWSKGVAGPQAELCPAGPSGPEDKPHSTVGHRLATSFHPILSPKEPGPPGAAPCRRVGAEATQAALDGAHRAR